MDYNEIGETLTKIDLWLDGKVHQDYKDQPLAQDWGRVGKIGEELGEAIEELIAYTGQNPRKGRRGNDPHLLLAELSDVVATGILAIQHFTKDWTKTEEVLWDKFITLRERLELEEKSNPVELHARETRREA